VNLSALHSRLPVLTEHLLPRSKIPFKTFADFKAGFILRPDGVLARHSHIRHGSTCRNVNHYLKWAFVEAANCAIRMKAHREDHIGLLYHRLYPNKGHGRAVVAVARHLAEASYWVLRKKQHYRAPKPRNAG
jgi:hypothetical protein